MNDLIEKMYEEDFLHLHSANIIGEEYAEALEKLCKLENELLDKFPECRELLEDFQTVQCDILGISKKHEFILGFRLGAQLILEVLKPFD